MQEVSGRRCPHGGQLGGTSGVRFLEPKMGPFQARGTVYKGEWSSSTFLLAGSFEYFLCRISFNPHKSLLKWVLLHSPHFLSEKLKRRGVKLPRVNLVGSVGLVLRKGDFGLGLPCSPGPGLGSPAGEVEARLLRGGDVEVQRRHDWGTPVPIRASPPFLCPVQALHHPWHSAPDNALQH